MFRKYVRLRIDKRMFLLYIDNRTVVRDHTFDKWCAKVEEEKGGFYHEIREKNRHTYGSISFRREETEILSPCKVPQNRFF